MITSEKGGEQGRDVVKVCGVGEFLFSGGKACLGDQAYPPSPSYRYPRCT